MVCSLGIGRMEVMARFLAGSFSQTIADDFGRSAAEYICRELREADEVNLLDEEGVFGSAEGEGLLYWHHLGHMLMIVDNEEFYEHERPLSLKDIRSLIIILRQALWQLLWVNHTTNPNSLKSASANSASKRQSVEAIQQRSYNLCYGIFVAPESEIHLQDWNNRRQFTSPDDFHADGVNDIFISQVGTPICIPSRDFIDIGRIASIENNHTPVDYAKKGPKGAIKCLAPAYLREIRKKGFKGVENGDNAVLDCFSHEQITKLASHGDNGHNGIFPLNPNSSNLYQRFHENSIVNCMLELQNLKNNLVLGLCKKLQAAGWPIVLLSRGNGSDRNVTVDNLGKARFRSCWSSLMMRSNIYIQHNISYSFTNLSEVASSQ
ncbi:hypothetical protein S245_007897, partial [Arachis hypogaea]